MRCGCASFPLRGVAPSLPVYGLPAWSEAKSLSFAVSTSACSRRGCAGCLHYGNRRGAAEAGAGLHRRLAVMVQAVWFDAGALTRPDGCCSTHPSPCDRRVVDGGPGARSLLRPGRGLSLGREAVALAARGTSFRRWAHRLVGEAQAAGRVAECLGPGLGPLSKPVLYHWLRGASLSGRATSAAAPDTSRSRCRLCSRGLC